MAHLPLWNRAAFLDSRMFKPLHPVIGCLDEDSFPTIDSCNALLSLRHPTISVSRGIPLRFVRQPPGPLAFEEEYEPRCFLTGEVQMRSSNWHDLFNALVWLTFPKTKAILNERHYDEMVRRPITGNNGRGALRDVSTLFDESGVIVAYTDAEMAGFLLNFRWKELFWEKRSRCEMASSGTVAAGMGFYLFGHSLYEKAMKPYVGYTGHALLVDVERDFFSWPLEAQLAGLDAILQRQLAAPNGCRSNAALSPLPLLGIPGWAAGNGCESYYDNTAYFRPGRATKRYRRL
jgi:hypothetical protein